MKPGTNTLELHRSHRLSPRLIYPPSSCFVILELNPLQTFPLGRLDQFQSQSTESTAVTLQESGGRKPSASFILSWSPAALIDQPGPFPINSSRQVQQLWLRRTQARRFPPGGRLPDSSTGGLRGRSCGGWHQANTQPTRPPPMGTEEAPVGMSSACCTETNLTVKFTLKKKSSSRCYFCGSSGHALGPHPSSVGRT